MMKQSRRWLLMNSNMMVSLLILLGFSIGLAEAADRPSLPQSALRQIEALMLEKSSRSPVQQKISSRLWYASKMRRGDAIANGVSRLRSRVEVSRDNTTLVDIRAVVSESVLAQIEAVGGTIVNQFPRRRAIRARIPIDQVETIATMPQIQFLKPADTMMRNSHSSSAVNVTEGDVASKADQAREVFNVDGTGIKIGVLSDGVDSLADRQASGDVPENVTVLPGQAGSGDEGTAILEIVHDLAPAAELLFATALNGQVSFAENIEALRTAGADVIVDDIFYFAEPTFQDGVIAQAVNSVAHQGALYFSAAGNSGNVNDGTSGVWEGDFVAIDAPAVLGDGVIAHDFGGGTNANRITVDPPFVMTLSWADPQGQSGNDYDLYLLSPDLTQVFDASTNVQSGTQDPLELIDSGPFNDIGNRLVIVKTFGEDRYLHLNTHRGQLGLATDGQTSGHAATSGAFGVAAVNVATANGGVFTGGADNPVETFNSDGPRRMFFDENGVPVTPGNFSSTGGLVLQKPDLASADGVMTSTPGFNPFFGTSAAAPHAAGIAALVLEANPNLTPSEVRDILTSTALDIE
ncbi:MAG: S8 family serine peptidase, partial [Nitrospira sp.]|nr:S8 family serine peptidase [Nitrospira sp.]